MLDRTEQQPPSPEPAAQPAGGDVPSPSHELEEPAQKDHRWWSTLWSRVGHHIEDPEQVSQETSEVGAEPIAPSTVTLTEEDLRARVEREAQQLHDREVARRNREAAEAERKRLRDEDPWQYAQNDKQLEQQQQVREQQTAQLMQLLGHVGRQHDAATLDPLIEALPDAERQRILSLPNAGQGLPGRRIIMDEALKSYGRLEYERGYREAQAKLKRDPVFRKSVLHELRGNYDEPELYAGQAPSSEPEDNVSNRLRSAFFNR